MAYKIQQYSYFQGDDCTRFMTEIKSGAHYTPDCAIDKNVSGGTPVIMKDDAIKVSRLENNHCYYMHCSIKRDSNKAQFFAIKLVTIDEDGQVLNEKMGQKIQDITVAAGEGWADVECIFSPFVDFNSILFHPTYRDVEPIILYEEISEINNLCGDRISSSRIQQVSIQTRPGTLFAINKHGITIGPSGSFELAKDLIITNFLQCVKGADFKNASELEEAKNSGKSSVLLSCEKERKMNNFNITYMSEVR